MQAPGGGDPPAQRGNPFFAEVLLESWRDLLLAGVAALPEPTQAVLRMAAAGAELVGHELLDGGGYRFRHALISEAVRDDQLPGERAADSHLGAALVGHGRWDEATSAVEHALDHTPSPALQVPLESHDPVSACLNAAEGMMGTWARAGMSLGS